MNLKIEIRPCAGGKESDLLCEDLLNVYIKYCQKNNISHRINRFGKTIVLCLSGASNLLFPLRGETGIHKFQRVSKTERSGRIHTSTLSVAVLEDTVKENKFNVGPDDVRIDYFHCGGKGGQNVNKVQTGIRIVHIPSGITVESTNERSQKQNKNKAFKILEEKLLERDYKNKATAENNLRHSQVLDGERSESRRIYNEKRNIVQDLKTNKSCSYKDFFKGNIQLLV